MRQGQHNKNRSRGRSNNQRRPGGGGNPSNRVYESNGPDVKVRGTAQTVADKYLQLARDAVSTGDIVMSESYFQHAEHYNRIIAANQSQQQQQQQQQQARSQEAGSQESGSQESGPKGEGGQQADAAPGTGPQPVDAQSDGKSDAKSDDRPSGRKDKAEVRSNGETSGDVASFDGDLPQFLQKPAEDSEPAQKPKRTRRPSRAKTAKASEGDAADAPSETASADNQDDPASDAEIVAG